MCPRAIKAEHRGIIYVKMSIFYNRCSVSMDAEVRRFPTQCGEKFSASLPRASFRSEIFFPLRETRSRSAKVKTLTIGEINVQQNDDHFNIIVLYIVIIAVLSKLSWPQIIARIFSIRAFIITYSIFLCLENIIMNCSLFTLLLFFIIYYPKVILI